MKIQKPILLFLICAFTSLLLPISKAFPISSSIKSQNDYVFTLDVIRKVRIMISNFATDDLGKKYKEIQAQFEKVSKDYYAQHFVEKDESTKKYKTKFYRVKLNLSNLMEELAKIYIERTTELLNSTSEKSFDILIKYGRSGGDIKYLKRPKDPFKINVQKYKPEEYHFYYDKQMIETYLKTGYRKLEESKKLINHPDILIIKNKFKNKKDVKSEDLDYMIEVYSNAIFLCRLAKQYGIEIFKIVNYNNLITVQTQLEKYNVSPQSLDPIFDVRIPEKFKKDANDNAKLIHSDEEKRLPKDYPKFTGSEESKKDDTKSPPTEGKK